jgi:hypothetical protein
VKRRALIGLIAGAGGVALARSMGSVESAALAAPPVPPASARVEISVIHAVKADGGGSIDPRLRDLPQLTRDQPFVRYNVYRLLDRKDVSLERGRPVPYPLVNGRTLQVTLTDVTVDNGALRYHVRVEIGEPGKQAFLKLLEVTAGPSDPFFVAGQSYEGGTLFLELAVRS